MRVAVSMPEGAISSSTLLKRLRSGSHRTPPTPRSARSAASSLRRAGRSTRRTSPYAGAITCPSVLSARAEVSRGGARADTQPGARSPSWHGPPATSTTVRDFVTGSVAPPLDWA
ncbi:hypothetical protein [Streptomyces sp. NPDC127118]|uniref:hypothetical protein n=1 Tax=Streptomyces sp. NPDC127118 TaxID=3345369 RepID=UPI003637EC95